MTYIKQHVLVDKRFVGTGDCVALLDALTKVAQVLPRLHSSESCARLSLKQRRLVGTSGSDSSGEMTLRRNDWGEIRASGFQ